MRDKGAVVATVQQCLASWGATVKRADEAGYTFCLVGYFEIPETEHHLLWPLLAPLLDRIEGQGYQALVFKPNLPSVYDKTGSTVLGQLQGPWQPPSADQGAAGAPLEVHLWTTHYIHTREVNPEAADCAIVPRETTDLTKDSVTLQDPGRGGYGPISVWQLWHDNPSGWAAGSNLSTWSRSAIFGHTCSIMN